MQQDVEREHVGLAIERAADTCSGEIHMLAPPVGFLERLGELGGDVNDLPQRQRIAAGSNLLRWHIAGVWQCEEPATRIMMNGA